MLRSILGPLLGVVFTWWGLTLISILDSSIFFFVPLAIDVAIIVLSARTPKFFWLYAVLATAGSLCGSAVTYYIGTRVGEAGLRHFVPEKRLNRL